MDRDLQTGFGSALEVHNRVDQPDCVVVDRISLPWGTVVVLEEAVVGGDRLVTAVEWWSWFTSIMTKSNSRHCFRICY
jgi:hypothetical protein